MSSIKNYRFRLYVAGDSTHSVQARENIRVLCDKLIGGAYEIEVVDLLRDPERALRDRILVTPTLVKLDPGPEKRIVGNLSQTEIVRQVLGLGIQTS